MSGRLAELKARIELLKAALRVIGNEIDDGARSYSDDESAYAWEQLALAARELTRATDALSPDQQPVGWQPKILPGPESAGPRAGRSPVVTPGQGTLDPMCGLCDIDRHVCPGCGTPVPHGTVACEACNAL